MNYEEIKTLVANNPRKTFTIFWKGGLTSTGRLFISRYGDVCIFRKRSRKWGDILCGIDNTIERIEVKGKQYDDIATFKRNVRAVIKYLSASGLWSPMLETAKVFLTLTDEQIRLGRTFGGYEELMKNIIKDGHWYGSDCYDTLFYDRCIKTVNYNRWTREMDTQKVCEAIANKTNYHTSWRKGYDNSLEVNFNGYARGWYSEEYKDCGNGHYYFLLDEKHIIFGEND